MHTKGRQGILVWSAAHMTLLAAAALGASVPEGVFSGHYQCQTSDLRIVVDFRANSVQAEFDPGITVQRQRNRWGFPGAGSKGPKAVTLHVRRSSTEGEIELDSGDEQIQLDFRIRERVRMVIAYDSDKGVIEGRFKTPGCESLVLVRGREPDATQLRVAKQSAGRRASLKKRDEDRARSGYVPPELAEFPSNRICTPDDPCRIYMEASGGESTPAERAQQELRNDGARCLQTATATGDGQGGGSAPGYVTGGWQSFLIDCTGDCSGVRYFTLTEHGGNIGFRHHGKTKPVPVLETSMPLFASSMYFEWRFFGFTPNTRIRIHKWSKVAGSYGDGCRFVEPQP